jgi:hypothetical protein
VSSGLLGADFSIHELRPFLCIVEELGFASVLCAASQLMPGASPLRKLSTSLLNTLFISKDK